jgi:hypothetical protein
MGSKGDDKSITELPSDDDSNKPSSPTMLIIIIIIIIILAKILKTIDSCGPKSPLLQQIRIS